MLNKIQSAIEKEEGFLVVTGALGFIGSATVQSLNEMGISRIILSDDLNTNILQNSVGHDQWKNLVGKKFFDLIDKKSLIPFLERLNHKIFGIIHLGACSDTTETNTGYLMETNYRYSIDLARYALQQNIPFIYASSAATYGNHQDAFDDDAEKIDTLSPLNQYGFSKQLFDQWILRRNLFNKVVGLKYFNVFGPNEYHKGNMASMVMHMYNQITSSGYVNLFRSSDPARYRDGEQLRDFIYIKDAVKMTLFFLTSKIRGIFNVGTGTPTSWNQLASLIFQTLNKETDIRYIPMPTSLIKQYQNYTCANRNKFLTALKTAQETFHYNYPIKEAVEDYIKNYLIPNIRW